MEVVAVLKTLWRYRIAVAVGAIVAMGVAFGVARQGTSRIGVASMRVMLDTPKSVTVDANSSGTENLEWRATALGDLMSTSESRQRIAREMRIPLDSLVVTAPYMSQPAAPFPLPGTALDAAAASETYRLAIQSVDLPPIIEIDARAPSGEKAGQLAAAGADALKAAAAVDVIPRKTEEFVIRETGPPRVREVVGGPGRLMSAIAGAAVFAVCCAGIVLLAAVASVRRRRGARRASGFGWT